MTKLLALALLVAACSDSTPTSTATAPTPTATATATAGTTATAIAARAGTSDPSLTGGAGQPSVDPTMPSWAPPSCLAYHKAVVLALECVAITQTQRDEISLAYGVASQAWKAEQNSTAARIEQVGLACERSTASVSAASAGKCVLART